MYRVNGVLGGVGGWWKPPNPPISTKINHPTPNPHLPISTKINHPTPKPHLPYTPNFSPKTLLPKFLFFSWFDPNVPNGAPTGVDPLEVLEQMSMKGICIYSVGCEPALSNYMHATAFMVAAAEKTNGQAVSLSSAASLADVIMGGAIEEMDLEQLTSEVVQEVKTSRMATGAAADSSMADDEVAEVEAKVWATIQARGHQTRHMNTKKLKAKSAAYVVKASSLAEARETLQSLAPPPPPSSACASVRTVPQMSRMRGCRSAAPAAGLDFMMSCRSDDYGWSDDECEGGSGSKESTAKGGVKLESRNLSFQQMHRIVGKQRKMGLL